MLAINGSESESHQRRAAPSELLLIVFFYSRLLSAAQPSPSTVPKTEDQRPQLGVFQKPSWEP